MSAQGLLTAFFASGALWAMLVALFLSCANCAPTAPTIDSPPCEPGAPCDPAHPWRPEALATFGPALFAENPGTTHP